MVNSMVERATSSQLIGPDWAMNIEICDILNHDPGQAKDVVKGIKKRMGSKNPKVQLLSLTLLETVVKNCGDVVHMHVAERDIPHEMVKIARKKPDFQVKEKILTLIDTWQEAFGGPRARYPQYYAAYQELLRAGAVFPHKSESSAPVFTPPQTQPLSSYPPNLRNINDRQETAEASSEAEYPSLSLTEIQNAKGIMDVLSEMLSAIEPANKESLRQEVIVDLVEQCRTYKQRVVHLVNSTSDESLLCQGLALNDDLQKVLAKHEALVSGTPVPQDKSKPESSKSPATVDGPLVDTGESSKQADVRASTGGTIPTPQVNGSAPTPTPTKPEPKMDLLSGDLLGDDFTSPTPQDSLALVPVSIPQPSSPVASHQNALALVDMFSTPTSSNSQPPTSAYPPPDFQHQQNLQQLPPQQSTPYANGMATSMGLGSGFGLPQQQYEQPGYQQPQQPQTATHPGWNNPQISQQLPQQQSPSYGAYNPQPPQPASYGGAYNPQIAQQQPPQQQPQSPVYGAQNGGSFPPPPWEAQAAETNQPFSPTQTFGSNNHPFSSPNQQPLSPNQAFGSNHHPFSPNQQPLSPNQQPLNPNQPFNPAQYSPSMQVQGQVQVPQMYSQQMMGGQQMPNQMTGMYPQGYPGGPMMGMGMGPYQMQAAQMAAMYPGQMYSGQMGGYGYGFGQQPDSGSQYLDQRMYGLSLRDDSSLRMSSSQNSVPSYLPPMKQQPKGDDKLFGDLVDMAKLKPTKSNTPARTGSV